MADNNLNIRRCRNVRHALVQHLQRHTSLPIEDALWLAAMTYRLEEQFILESLDWDSPACQPTATRTIISDWRAAADAS